jgi:hypothetical protein
LSESPYFVVNRNAGVDTLHENPREECNVDDAEGRATVDPATGAALKASGDIHLCRHCIEQEEG